MAVEAVECPTLLYNGFGEHNIQGIGDKHVPLIHNVMNTDVVIGVSDRATDRLAVLFNTDSGRRYLKARQGVRGRGRPAPRQPAACRGSATSSPRSSWRRQFSLGADDLIVTVATDGADLYRSEERKALDRYFAGQFDEVDAAEVFGEHLLGAATDHVLELTHRDRERVFNLGYYTWVEQQGVSVAEFEARRHQPFWRSLQDLLPAWDAMIDEFNARASAA